MTEAIVVEIQPDGIRFGCFPDETILRAAERLAVRALPVGCRGGGCGVCRIRVLTGGFSVGRMSRAHISAADLDSGVTLACRTVPRESMTIEILGRIERPYGTVPQHAQPDSPHCESTR